MRRHWEFWGPTGRVEPEVRTFFRTQEQLVRIGRRVIHRHYAARKFQPLNEPEPWRMDRGLFEFWPSLRRPLVFRIVVPPVGHAPGWDANGSPVEGDGA